MTVPGLDKGLPDVSGTAMVAASAMTTVGIYVATLFNLNPPPEVSSAITTLIALGFGLWRGTGFKKYGRRHSDTPGGSNA